MKRHVLLTSATALIAAACVTATPAGAQAVQETTTVQHMVAKGIVVRFPGVEGIEIPVTYHPGGKYTAMGGSSTGTWRIDGDALCAKGATDAAELCTHYPPGKKPGDQFEVQSPQGAVMIEINK
jgi:hypothetical protein